MSRNRRNAGFTLTELMITVVLIGILAAIAIPNFLAYQAKSRRAEAYANVVAIATSELSFQAETDSYIDAGAFPDFTPYGGLGTHKMTWDAASVAEYSLLGWAPEGEVAYSYEVNAGLGGPCSCTLCFTATAHGDVDGDGTRSAVMYVYPEETGGVHHRVPVRHVRVRNSASERLADRQGLQGSGHQLLDRRRVLASERAQAKRAASRRRAKSTGRAESPRHSLGGECWVGEGPPLAGFDAASWRCARSRPPRRLTWAWIPARARREEAQALPSAAQARVSVLGFAAVVADYYWLQAMHLVGSLRGDVDSEEPRIAGLIELVTGLDPWVDHPYRFAAIWLNDGPESIQRANRLLERAIAYHPLDWRNRHYLGFNHFYHLDDAAARGRGAGDGDRTERGSALPRAPGREAARRRGQPRRRRSAAGRAREHDARRVREGALPEVPRRDRDGAPRALASTRRASNTGGATAATSRACRICSARPRPCSAACPRRIRTSRTSPGCWIRRPTRSPRPSTDRAIGSSTTTATRSASSAGGRARGRTGQG